jgi:transaldolase/glucose-6-phosphate isomerase
VTEIPGQKPNPLRQLQALGQSLWLEALRRALITSGELQQLIEEDGLSGVTTNPSLVEKVLAGSHEYDTALLAWAREGRTAEEIRDLLAVEDAGMAADLLRPIYEETEGRDGFVSLEVSARFARDTGRTVDEARRLWTALGRPNVLITVPATREGLPAIRELTRQGINVNVTLIFGPDRYGEVLTAYLEGLEARAAAGEPLDRITSVASFSLSRIDTLVDSLVRTLAGPPADLFGRAAIASAKIAYQAYVDSRRSSRFRALAARGARPLRLLWTSTGTKSPAHSDVMYVESLIGPETIAALPLETLNAFRRHGRAAPTLEGDLEGARRTLARLVELGIDHRAVAEQLERDGVDALTASGDHLLATIEEKRRVLLSGPASRDQQPIAGPLQAAVEARLRAFERERFAARLWRRDPSLWTTEPREEPTVLQGLGWLHVAEKMEDTLADLLRFCAEVRDAGFRHVVHMGLGGSSLAPLVFARTWAPGPGGLPVTVLDTTDPATLLRIERRLPLTETLFIVASKSGTTAEPVAFGEYFYWKARALGGEGAGRQFVAITDPGTPLAEEARRRGYRRVFENFPDIGGRYSALSYFGLVPAALMGLDVAGLLDRAQHMAHACASCVPLADNPGVTLGALLGEAARGGRDKVTLLVAEPVSAFGLWLEQLLAESSGKKGTGLLPVAGEPLGDPAVYGADRVFVHVGLAGHREPEVDAVVAGLRSRGHPVVSLEMGDLLDMGQEFFRWEVATATACAVLGVNAFDQPNVQESKENTDRMLEAAGAGRGLPDPEPTLVDGPVQVYAEEAGPSLALTLARFLALGRPGDYIALQAYLPETPGVHRALQAVRRRLRDATHLATTLGYGPRFLHSTGQYHKGGPNTGLFLQLTAQDAEDVPIPGRPYTFGVFKRAQALGDLEALRKHGRRILRLHLTGELPRALEHLAQAVAAALDRPL